MTLETVATALYRTPITEFVRARAAAQSEAKDAGEMDLARDIGKLPKPSMAAWLVNLLVAERREELDEIVALGEQLRAAEKNLDPKQLRTLGRQRQQLIASVARLGTEVGAQAGSKASSAAVHELEQTLQAALADASAADAVLTGVLVRGLTSTGVESVDLSDAVAVNLPSAPRASARNVKPRLRAVDTTATERDIEKARRRLADAEDRADDALAAVDTLRKQLKEVGPELDRLTEEHRSLKARLADVENELAARSTENDELSKNLADARHESDVAERAVSRARERVDHLAERR